MQRRNLIARNIRFLKNFITIYMLFILLFFSALIPGFISNTVSANSNSYYVSTSGSDSNDGSLSNPFKTIQKAVNVSTNGDTIYVMVGIYLPSTGQINIKNKNTANKWLTLRNYNNDHVILDGTNCPMTNYINATIEIKNSKYIRITGITINHSAKGGITLRTKPISFIRIDNCTISNSSSFACKVANGMNNITFEYNYVYNNFNNWSGTLMSQETLSFENVTTFSINHNTCKANHAGAMPDMKGGCNRGVVCFNEINTTGGYVFKGSGGYGGCGIMLDARGLSHNISIYNNRIYGNVTGISLNTETTGHYEYIYIYNNVVSISATGGASTANGRNPILLSNTGGSTELFHNIYIYSNTFVAGVGNDASVFTVGHYVLNQLNAGNLRNVYVINNVFYGSYTSSGYEMWEINKISFADNVFIVNNNSFYRPSGLIKIYWNGTSYTSGGNPEKFGGEPVFTNPLFADKNGGDFHLNSTSPCINVGSNVLVSASDFDGVSRPQGSGFDIGAFEFSSTYDITPPQISNIIIVTSSPLDTNVNFGWENFSCIVTDNVGVDTILLQITYPNKTTTNFLMIKKTASDTYYSNRSLNQAGNYSYVIKATDTSNNVALSLSHIFLLSANWDINNDGRCSILDLILVSNHYNQIGSNGWIREDVDNNGVITLLDMSLVSSHYDESWYT